MPHDQTISAQNRCQTTIRMLFDVFTQFSQSSTDSCFH